MLELSGVIHGRYIELESEPGIGDGQRVRVRLEPVPESAWPAGEGIRQSAGGWSEDAEELDAFLEWNRRQRTQDRDALP